MGWKGTVRSVGAVIRAAERDAKRRQRELEREQKHYEKMELLEQAAYEVDVYENQIEIIQSLHKDCSDLVDWHTIATSAPPKEPRKTSARETEARNKAKSYKPGFIDNLFKRADKKQKGLNEAISEAHVEDANKYKAKLQKWKSNVNDWEESTKLAKLLIDGDGESKLDVIKELNPFAEISNIGSNISFIIHDNSILEAEIHILGERVVPSEKKSLLQSGKLSVKNTPKGIFYEVYQDYVCSCTLRVANELLAILPEKMVVITAVDKLLNTKSGHLEKLPILSVAIPRRTLESLNMNNIDPSDPTSYTHNIYRGVNRVGK